MWARDRGGKYDETDVSPVHLTHRECCCDEFRIDVRGREQVLICSRCGEPVFKFFRGVLVSVCP